MMTEQPTIRVTWKGKSIGHGRWIERTVIVHSEDDARALVAAPMEADFTPPTLMCRSPPGGAHWPPELANTEPRSRNDAMARSILEWVGLVKVEYGQKEPMSAATEKAYEERCAKAEALIARLRGHRAELLQALFWCVDNSGECLSDHQLRLVLYQALLRRCGEYP